MILEWKTHRIIDDMKEVTYKREYLRIHKKGSGDFIGFVGNFDMVFEDDTFEGVEKKMIDFCDLTCVIT